MLFTFLGQNIAPSIDLKITSEWVLFLQEKITPGDANSFLEKLTHIKMSSKGKVASPESRSTKRSGPVMRK